MKRTMLLLLMVLSTTGCKVLHHAKSAAHGERPHTDQPLYNLPPAQMLMHPGPGVDGPGPGVLMPEPMVQAVGPASQVAFVGPTGMQVTWDVGGPGLFDSEPLIAPGRYNFPQGAIYRLKLTNIPGRPGIELYPTVEIGPAMPRTEAYLAHNSIPVQFTEEDFDQVLSGNFVTKVIYLPDPEFQELAIAGVETLVSTRLDLGVDPIVEADRRGSIMAIVRLGNKDLQVAAPGAVPAFVPGGVPGSPEMVLPMSYNAAMGGMPGAPLPMGAAGHMSGQADCPPGAMMGGGYNYVSGVTTPQYGMTTSGTPIGLPGPPHIPFGVPAGLCYHAVHNHTHQRIPHPVNHFNVHVKQEPGFRYPHPVSTVNINEQAIPNPPVTAPCGPHCGPNCPHHGYAP